MEIIGNKESEFDSPFTINRETKNLKFKKSKSNILDQ